MALPFGWYYRITAAEYERIESFLNELDSGNQFFTVGDGFYYLYTSDYDDEEEIFLDNEIDFTWYEYTISSQVFGQPQT